MMIITKSIPILMIVGLIVGAGISYGIFQSEISKFQSELLETKSKLSEAELENIKLEEELSIAESTIENFTSAVEEFLEVLAEEVPEFPVEEIPVYPVEEVPEWKDFLEEWEGTRVPVFKTEIIPDFDTDVEKLRTEIIPTFKASATEFEELIGELTGFPKNIQDEYIRELGLLKQIIKESDEALVDYDIIIKEFETRELKDFKTGELRMFEDKIFEFSGYLLDFETYIRDLKNCMEKLKTEDIVDFDDVIMRSQRTIKEIKALTTDFDVSIQRLLK